MAELIPKLILIAMCIGVSIVAYCAAAVAILLVRDIFRKPNKRDNEGF